MRLGYMAILVVSVGAMLLGLASPAAGQCLVQELAGGKSFGAGLLQVDSKLFVGAPNLFPDSKVFVYERDDSAWSLATELASAFKDQEGETYFGGSMAASATVLAVSNLETKTVELFDLATLAPVDVITGSYMYFGRGLDISQNLLAIGSPFALVDGESRGRIHIYEKSPDGWDMAADIPCPEESQLNCFGTNVIILDDDNVLASDHCCGEDKVYQLRRGAAGWAVIGGFSRTSISGNKQFGKSLAVTADRQTLVVGAPATNVSSIDEGVNLPISCGHQQSIGCGLSAGGSSDGQGSG